MIKLTKLRTDSKSLDWELLPHLSGMSSISWLCVLSDMQRRVTISNVIKSASDIPIAVLTELNVARNIRQFSIMSISWSTSKYVFVTSLDILNDSTILNLE